ncbi:phage major capsid protein [Kineococcus sp. TBRC 1896]|uniref:Phage major capsid protein n=2 Tax=Kineococcus mangrovi TaxID=1660183 RepID=A0ABV4HZK6_9ACTN
MTKARNLSRQMEDMTSSATAKSWTPARQEEFARLDADFKSTMADAGAAQAANRIQALMDPDDRGGRGNSASRIAGKGLGSSWGRDVADQLRQTADGVGTKALTNGSIGVPSPIVPDIVRQAEEPLSLLNLLVNRTATTANEFSYVQQNARTNNAAMVPDGAVKPTSVFTVEEVTDRVRVLAHLSEPITERLFADHVELERFLTVELQAGLLEALEGQIVAGDGTGENLTGLLALPGTTPVTASADVFTTTRKALTTLRRAGERPTAWVFSPEDDEELDLAREDGTTGQFILGGNALEATQPTLWGLPRIVSPKMPAGTALLADWSQVRLVIREDARLDADRSGELFTHNQVVLRVEGRYGLAALRPSAVAVVDLAA